MQEKLIRIIKAVSLGRMDQGSIGFLTTQPDESKKWFNVTGEPEVLEEIIKSIIAKGNKIEFEYDNGVVGTLKLIEKAKEADKKNWAEDMTNFEDLLNAAHTKFKDSLSIMTEMLDVDFDKKTAVFKATVIIDTIDPANPEMCRKFEGHGDAQGIASESIKPHFMRMAETRAIARALRWATNNAMVAKEETGETDPEGILAKKDTEKTEEEQFI